MDKRITSKIQHPGGPNAPGRVYPHQNNYEIKTHTLQQKELQSQQEQLINSLIDSQERGQAAAAALGQIIDLIDSVREGMSSQQQHNAPVANARLLASAAATVSDIADYTTANGKAVFEHTATAHGAQERIALAAYNSNRQAFSAAKPTNEPNEFRHAMAMAQSSVSGPNGVVTRLTHMAESGPVTGPEADAYLQQLSDTLNRVRERINQTTSQDIAQAISAFNPSTNGAPLDVAV